MTSDRVGGSGPISNRYVPAEPAPKSAAVEKTGIFANLKTSIATMNTRIQSSSAGDSSRNAAPFSRLGSIRFLGRTPPARLSKDDGQAKNLRMEKRERENAFQIKSDSQLMLKANTTKFKHGLNIQEANLKAHNKNELRPATQGLTLNSIPENPSSPR